MSTSRLNGKLATLEDRIAQRESTLAMESKVREALEQKLNDPATTEHKKELIREILRTRRAPTFNEATGILKVAPLVEYE